MFNVSQKIFLDLSNYWVPIDEAGRYENLLRDAINKVREIYVNTNVDIVLEPPEYGNYTTIYLHNIGDDPNINGLAFQDRTFNPSDQGVIYVDHILKWSFESGLNIEQQTNAMANVLGHEIGHTMGLEHIDDPSNLMYPTSEYFDNGIVPLTSDQMMAVNINSIVSNLEEDISEDSVNEDFDISADYDINDQIAGLSGEGIDYDDDNDQELDIEDEAPSL